MNLAPIVLFTYNRPWHTRQTVESLQQNKLATQSDLIIYSDGPKEGEDDTEIYKVRDYLRTISGFKSISIIESPQNMGLARSTIRGVTEVVNKHGKIIVLEDDLLTSPDFLRFMNEALDHYDNHEKVMQISGHMFNVNVNSGKDGVFLPFTNSIGWATWSRAWSFFDSQAQGFDTLTESREVKGKFNLDGAYDFYGMLKGYKKNLVDSWAICWYLAVFLQKGLVLYPTRNLVTHIGFGSGTHCKNISEPGFYSTTLSEFNGDTIEYPEIILDKDDFNKIKSFIGSKKSFKKTVYDFIKKVFPYRVKF